MAFNIKFVVIFIVFTVLLFSLAPNPTKADTYGIDTNVAETKHIGNQSYFPQWLFATFNVVLGVVLGFVLSFFGTYITDCLRERRKIKRFYQTAYSELKQVLAELSLYMLHPDSTIDEEKVQLWWNFMHNFDLPEVISPAENNEMYEKLKKLGFTPARITDFVSSHNLLRERRQSQGKMMPMKKLNCTYISHNIETVSILDIHDTSRLLNILRRADALNSCMERIDFAFKKSFDSSISSGSRDNIVSNYYSDCQVLSDAAKTTAKEVSDILTKWQKEKLCSDVSPDRLKKAGKDKAEITDIAK